MEPNLAKHSLFRNILVRLFLFFVVIICFRFAYVVTIRGESCDIGDFCFFSSPEDITTTTTTITSGSKSSSAISAGRNSAPAKPDKVISTDDYQKAVNFYSSIFEDLILNGFLRPDSKTLCIDTEKGHDVAALKEIGVLDSIGIHKKGLKPFVIKGEGINQPFADNSFDFIFSGDATFEKASKPVQLAAEISRTLKPEGFLVVHTGSNDTYSFNSFINLFNSCKLIKTTDLDTFNPNIPRIREIVMKKMFIGSPIVTVSSNTSNTCSVPFHKRELIRKAEPLIPEEPKKPWITLKKNIQNVKYLPSIVDINFKQRYIYIDVGSRSYGSSIVSWFKKQYPKQNKTFEIFAIEADKHFHKQYSYKKGVTLLPYAAWVKNESLFFEVNHDPGDKSVIQGRGMGRIKPVQNSDHLSNNVDEIQGFDFAEWLKSEVTEKDFVVMKMDIEGTEFKIIPRLIESGAICLIDEIFLECHYNRWQKCCPGERSPKYEKSYDECLDLFTSLRDIGVLVHQWY